MLYFLLKWCLHFQKIKEWKPTDFFFLPLFQDIITKVEYFWFYNFCQRDRNQITIWSYNSDPDIIQKVMIISSDSHYGLNSRADSAFKQSRKKKKTWIQNNFPVKSKVYRTYIIYKIQMSHRLLCSWRKYNSE